MFNLEFFSDELLEKKVYHVDMSILTILLSPELGCYMHSNMDHVIFLRCQPPGPTDNGNCLPSHLTPYVSAEDM
jgi:hypothetical protein